MILRIAYAGISDESTRGVDKQIPKSIIKYQIYVSFVKMSVRLSPPKNGPETMNSQNFPKHFFQICDSRPGALKAQKSLGRLSVVTHV